MDIREHEPKIFFCLVVLCLFLIVPIHINKEGEDDADLGTEFDYYIKQFHKPYLKGTNEYQKRYILFRKSWERFNKLNGNRNSDHSAVFGLTKFSDMGEEEFDQLHLTSKCSSNLRNKNFSELFKHTHLYQPKNIPRVLDWRRQGIISAVKNQYNCGACWAFSISQTMESMYALNTGKLGNLSVQQLIDCTENGNYGCYGGDTCAALEWLTETNTSLVPETEYPLLLTDQVCITPKNESGLVVTNFTCNNFVGHENALLKALTMGPVVAAVDAALWQDYISGVIHFHCATNLNHAVQIVGYNITAPIPYYIVRNTWGTEYGDKGYVKVAIGSNMCGIAMQISHIDVVHL